jgi:hypothetical protein
MLIETKNNEFGRRVGRSFVTFWDKKKDFTYSFRNINNKVEVLVVLQGLTISQSKKLERSQ